MHDPCGKRLRSKSVTDRLGRDSARKHPLEGQKVHPLRLALPLTFATLALSACSFQFGPTDVEPSPEGQSADETEPTEPAEPDTAAASEEPADQTDSGSGVDRLAVSEVEAAAADALEPQLGARPTIDCGILDIHPFDGLDIECTMIEPGTGEEYDTTVTFTGVEGDQWNITVSVASTPN